MPCKLQIEQHVKTDVEKRSDPGFNMSLTDAKFLANEINSLYTASVVEFFVEADSVSRRIEVPQELIDFYYERETIKEENDARDVQREDAERAGEEYTDDYLFQNAPNIEMTPASTETLNKVKDIISKMGVKIENLVEYGKRRKLDITGANAVADTFRRIIAVAEGKENVALTEEMVHMATTFLEEKDPSLMKEMISKIGRFKIYRQVLDEYRNNPYYQKDGKPDIRKIKKEAADRLIAELFIYNTEGNENFPELAMEEERSTWRLLWEKVMDFFRGMYKDSNIDIFQEVSEQIAEGETEMMFQLQNDNKILGESIKELDRYLLDFLKPFGVLSKDFDSLKDRLGVDALGATDVLNKLIWYTKNRNEETVPEEVGHMAVMLMGENHSDIEALMSEITNWSEYKSVYDQYMPIYKNEKQVKVEAIGKVIAKSLVKNYKANGINKTLLQKALDSLTKILESVNDLFSAWNYSEKLADKIAINILVGNTDYIGNLSPKGVKLDYKKALEGNNLAKSIIKEYAERLGHKLVGSLAIAGQGETIYRPETELIHDLDFVVDNPSENDLQRLKNSLENSGAVPVHSGWSKPDQGYTTYSYFIPQPGYSIQVNEKQNNWVKSIMLFDVNGNVVRDIKNKVIGVDFFVYDRPSGERTVDIFKSANDIYFGKLGLSGLGVNEVFFQREKDQTDYILSNFRNRNLRSNKAFVYYQLSNDNKSQQLAEAQKPISNAILDTQKKLRKQEMEKSEKGKIDPILMDTEEATNWYEIQKADGTWEKIKRRVTDRVKQFYRDTFGTKTFTKEEQEFNEFKRDNGIKFHKFAEEIHNKYFNPDGTRKQGKVDSPYIPDKVDREIFQRLEKYFISLLNQHSKDGNIPLVFSEVMVYDPVAKEAGTIDLLVVDGDGTTHIYDWKFMSRGRDSEDIAWYKKGAYNIQLGRYKDILIKNYGVKKMGRNRAVPIVFNLEKNKNTEALEIKGITMGSLDFNKETPLYLVPFSEETESTGFEKLDRIIQTLNAVQKQIKKENVTTDEEKEFKRERLQSLQRASRIAHATHNLEPLLETLELTRRDGELIVNDYNTAFAKKDVNDPSINDQVLSDFSETVNNFLDIAEAFSSMDTLLSDLIYTEEMEDTMDKEDVDQRREVKRAFDSIVSDIRKSIDDVKTISNDFADKFIGNRNFVTGLLKEEPVVKGLSSIFRGVSELPTKSTKVLFRILNLAKNKASQKALERVDKILAIKKRLEDRNVDLKSYVKKIYQKDKEGSFVNELIYKFSKDFYELMDSNSKEGFRDRNVIIDNIDVEKYKEHTDKIIDNRIRYLKKIYENDPEGLNDLIIEEKKKWDVTRKDFNGWNNHLIKRYPKQKWVSEEYLDVKKDKDLFELYELVTEINSEAAESGYISNYVRNSFLPFIRKSMAENMTWRGMGKGITNFAKSIELRPDDMDYGKINELTGKVDGGIPKYFTVDFSRKEDGRDMSDVSEEIFQNLITYTQHVERYKHLSEVEDQIKLLRRVESFKNHLETGASGNIIKKGGRYSVARGNEENLKMLDDFINTMMYSEKYPLSSDTAIDVTKVKNGTKKLINSVAGKEIFSETEKPSFLSLTKSMETINRLFQLKTLGFEIISGAANAFGGNIQMATQSGNYFSVSEFIKNEAKLIGNSFKSKDEREMFVQLIEKFMPLKDDPAYEKYKEAGMNVLTQQSFSDILMVFMRQPEILLEKSVFLTLLENSMAENGKIVSIREYVKKKYPDRYTTARRYSETKDIIEKEIQKLKETKSLWNTKKLEEGKLVIPGLDMNNIDEMQRLTSLTRTLSRNATGSLSDGDVNKASMNIWMRSMMVFKNWIPKLLDTRFGEFRKIYDDFSVSSDGDFTTGEKYDIGRIRLWFYVMGTSIRDRSLNTMNILQMNDKGIELLNKMYEEFAESYENRSGEEFTLSKEEFFDLIRNNLRNQIRELGMLLTMVSSTFAMGMIAPDDDDSKAAKNAFRYYEKAVDKFIDELSFFYNPLEFQRMLSGSAFPAIGLFSDLARFNVHMMMELTGLDISDTEKTVEEVRKDAQPVKHLARMFPITKSIMTYGAIISDEFAEEFDITIQSQPRR